MNAIPPPARPRSRIAGLLGFVAGFGAAVVLTGAVLWWLFWRTGTHIDLSRPTIVQHVQQLHRLETVVYSMEKIVSASQDSAYFPRVLVGDRILLIVYGEVTAGIDLSQLDAESLQVQGRAIQMALPASAIFSTRLDNARTQVYSRETGLFTHPDPNFESQVRREAERQVQQAALDGGILANASANARTTLTTFLKGLGFEDVQVR
jgi:hypothetical protein